MGVAIKHKRYDDNFIPLLIGHVLLGVAIYFFEVIARVYFLGVLFYFLWHIITRANKDKTMYVLLGCAYIAGGEVFLRMTKGYFFYETGKYFVLLLMLMGIFYKGVSGKAYPYFLYLILLVPAVIVASITLTYDANFRTNVTFVLAGPVTLGIAALFCYDKKLTQQQILKVLQYLVLPIISMTVYLFLYNPSIRETISNTASNSATSGGFGPNQVSTALGMGMLVMVVRIYMQSPSFFLRILNIGIFAAISFRAIVTFSRGGVFAAIICVLAFLGILFLKSNYKVKNQIIGSTIVFLLAIGFTWMLASVQTSGMLDKRYANEDSLGREKGDVSTGRGELFMQEMDGFLQDPIFGIGASRTKDIRVKETGEHLPTHNEVGRLLGEHGMFGIMILLILIIKPLVYRATNSRSYFFYAFLCFWFATINHSAMRIAAPSLFYALALLDITNVKKKNTIHRKQLTQ
ncbi:O-antigen ligase family protein [Winogradskyella sediminis]|uniref:O-antigen ligase family protein n=1 Tax=Winogradskyella sediminis TaxID=1382466 RepID=UPI000E233C0C|nr:O-antigen ligase family protein [Winogradskyella sediminis]REG87738.1 O-antigen ligase-like membrane protein [Winogradskyella sediminis]